jgi:hypothetical protein
MGKEAFGSWLLAVGFQLSAGPAAEQNFVEWASLDYIVVNKWDSAMVACKTKWRED